MKKATRMTLLGFLLLAVPLLGEAKITSLLYESESSGSRGKTRRTTQQWMLGDNVARIETTHVDGKPAAGPQKGSYAVLNGKTGRLYMVMPSRKTFMELDMAPATNPTQREAAGPSPLAEYRRTGEKREIAGLTCAVWAAETEDKLNELCVAKGKQMWVNFWSRDESQMGDCPVLPDMQGIPLEIVSRFKNGKKGGVRAIAKKHGVDPIDPELFAVPEGYEKMAGVGGPDIPGLGKPNTPSPAGNDIPGLAGKEVESLGKEVGSELKSESRRAAKKKVKSTIKGLLPW